VERNILALSYIQNVFPLPVMGKHSAISYVSATYAPLGPLTLQVTQGAEHVKDHVNILA